MSNIIMWRSSHNLGSNLSVLSPSIFFLPSNRHFQDRSVPLSLALALPKCLCDTFLPESHGISSSIRPWPYLWETWLLYLVSTLLSRCPQLRNTTPCCTRNFLPFGHLAPSHTVLGLGPLFSHITLRHHPLKSYYLMPSLLLLSWQPFHLFLTKKSPQHPSPSW